MENQNSFTDSTFYIPNITPEEAHKIAAEIRRDLGKDLDIRCMVSCDNPDPDYTETMFVTYEEHDLTKPKAFTAEYIGSILTKIRAEAVN